MRIFQIFNNIDPSISNAERAVIQAPASVLLQVHVNDRMQAGLMQAGLGMWANANVILSPSMCAVTSLKTKVCSDHHQHIGEAQRVVSGVLSSRHMRTSGARYRAVWRRGSRRVGTFVHICSCLLAISVPAAGAWSGAWARHRRITPAPRPPW